jgi:hypothetical protein
MVGNRGDPASVFRRHDYRVQCTVGRVGQRQHGLPLGCRIGRYLDHGRRVGDIDADLRYRRPLPAEGVEQRQGRRSAAGCVHHQIRVERLRASRAVDKLDAAHACAGGGRHDPGHPARRPQHDVRDRLGPSPQYQFDQRPGRAEHRDPEIPLRHHADIRPLELDVSHEGDGDRAGCGEITLETGENPFERAQAAGQQTVRVAILRRARPRSGGCWQAVTLDDHNLLKIFGQSAGGRKPANSGANDNRPLTQPARTAAIPRR